MTITLTGYGFGVCIDRHNLTSCQPQAMSATEFNYLDHYKSAIKFTIFALTPPRVAVTVKDLSETHQNLSGTKRL